MNNKKLIFLVLAILVIIFLLLKNAGVCLEITSDSNIQETACERSVRLIDLTADNFNDIRFDSQYAVVFFWTTWCGNCKSALPKTIQFCEENKIDLILVNNDSMNKKKVKQVLCEYGLAQGYYLSEENTLINALKDADRISNFMNKIGSKFSQQSGYPYTIIINQQNQIVDEYVGSFDLNKLLILK